MRRTGKTWALPAIGMVVDSIWNGVPGERAAPAGNAQPPRAPPAAATADAANRPRRELDMLSPELEIPGSSPDPAHLASARQRRGARIYAKAGLAQHSSGTP